MRPLSGGDGVGHATSSPLGSRADSLPLLLRLRRSSPRPRRRASDDLGAERGWMTAWGQPGRRAPPGLEEPPAARGVGPCGRRGSAGPCSAPLDPRRASAGRTEEGSSGVSPRVPPTRVAALGPSAPGRLMPRSRRTVSRRPLAGSCRRSSRGPERLAV